MHEQPPKLQLCNTYTHVICFGIKFNGMYLIKKKIQWNVTLKDQFTMYRLFQREE